MSERVNPRTVVGAMAVIAVLSGCDQLLMRKPEPDDMVGTYRLTKSSAEFLTKDKGYAAVPDCYIKLEPDMTVEIKNLADCADSGSGTSGGRFLSARGTWRIRGRFPGYDLDLEKMSGSLRSEYYTGWIQIRRLTPPHELDVVVGDPDSGEQLEYSREAE